VRTRNAVGLAFVTAFVTLSTQILVHRMVSVKLLNNYAFLVISLTMLGFAVSGVILSRWLPRFIDDFADTVTICGTLFVLTMVGASALFYWTPTSILVAETRPDFVSALLRSLPLALLYAVPFVFCGLILGALLSLPGLATPRIYGADLLGSAAGALAVLPALTRFGAEMSTLGACALMLIGTLVLARPRRIPARALAGLAGLVILASAIQHDRVFDMVYPEGSMLAAARVSGSGRVIEHISWDPVARIEVSTFALQDPRRRFAYPAFLGNNPAFAKRVKYMLTQNNWAFTLAPDYDGTPASLVGIEETFYTAPYHATSIAHPRVLVIGVGGGFDVLAGLAFGATSVTAAEINAATVRILTRTYRNYFRHWVEDPRVRLVNAEGRHFLTTTAETFDVITLSGVDTYSGTAGAAHVFSENYLYTAEAFDLFVSRLSDRGILSVQRNDGLPRREMLRLLTTAVDSLRGAGASRPADHILMLEVRDGGFVGMLVKKTPFTEAETQRVQRWAEASRGLFRVSVAPGLDTRRDNAYQIFLAEGNPAGEDTLIALYPFDISPSRDDRPFFFHTAFWWHLFPASPVVWSSVPVLEYTLTILLIIIGLAAALCVALPLRYLSGRGRQTPGTTRYAIFFAGIGLGYLAIELALIQKFSLFLGHPNYALSIVLAPLLFATGLGALAWPSMVGTVRHVRFVGYVLAAVVLAEYALVFPLLAGASTLSLWLRGMIVVALVMPIGVCLGMFFPAGLDRLKTDNPAFIPWAWGVNGVFSVLAPILAVALSITWGISALLITALPVYLIVGFVLPGRDSAV
jgi:spermidine synthase